MHPGVLDVCLKHDIHAANDISGFVSPAYAKKVADAGLPAFVMAANKVPGDPIGVDATLASLEGVINRCETAGVNEVRPRPRGRHLDTVPFDRRGLGTLPALRYVHAL